MVRHFSCARCDISSPLPKKKVGKLIILFAWCMVVGYLCRPRKLMSIDIQCSFVKENVNVFHELMLVA